MGIFVFKKLANQDTWIGSADILLNYSVTDALLYIRLCSSRYACGVWEIFVGPVWDLCGTYVGPVWDLCGTRVGPSPAPEAHLGCALERPPAPAPPGGRGAAGGHRGPGLRSPERYPLVSLTR